MLALFACSDEFTAEEKERDFAYYEALTVRDSSLSACTQAIVAAETGHLDLAYDYLGEAAFVDLHDLAHNTKDGLHMASLAGGWIALVCGFGGFRDHGGTLRFAPRLPEPLDRLRFHLTFRGRCVAVDVRTAEATYAIESGDALEVVHHGETVEVRPGEPVTRADPAGAAPRAPAPAAGARAAAAHAGPPARRQSGGRWRPAPLSLPRTSSGHGIARPVSRSMRQLLTLPSAAGPSPVDREPVLDRRAAEARHGERDLDGVVEAQRPGEGRLHGDARRRAEREVRDAERGVQRRLGRLGEAEHGRPVVDAGGVGVHPLDAPAQDDGGGVGQVVLV